jgi:hypothetical protein
MTWSVWLMATEVFDHHGRITQPGDMLCVDRGGAELLLLARVCRPATEAEKNTLWPKSSVSKRPWKACTDAWLSSFGYFTR